MKKTFIALTAFATLTGAAWGVNTLTKDNEHKVEASQSGSVEFEKFEATSTIKGTKIISAKTINELFKTNPDSKLNGLGDEIYKVSIENGIEPGFVAALVYYQTNNGRSKEFKENNNVMSILEKGTDESKKFSSKEESLIYIVERLRKNYLEYGLDNIEKFGDTYAPFWNRYNNKSFGEVYAEIMNKELKIQNNLK